MERGLWPPDPGHPSGLWLVFRSGDREIPFGGRLAPIDGARIIPYTAAVWGPKI
ncbi:MAG: hypothetical protein NZM03_12230 [Limisphaera sp.]|nr:hypothetical protein [Limisphaera sp.]